MKKKLVLIAAVVVLAAAILTVVLLTRGGDGKASAMWLVKAQGDVAVTDGGGSDVPVEAMPGLELRLGLYDGYSVGTQSESFGWINLDDTKLTKLDEDSKVQINRTGRELELVVDHGSLFFNVTKPLEDDETMEIRSSSMTMAIRGTCGWVRAEGETFDVYIIEGRVRVAASAAGSMVPAVEEVTVGQRAHMSVAEGTPTILVDTFLESEIPEFVLTEAQSDGDLREKLSDIGVTVPGGPENPGGSGNPGNPGGSGSSGEDWDTTKGDDDGRMGAHGDITWTIATQRPAISHNVPEVYFEMPILEGPQAGIEAINDYMSRRADGFIGLYVGGIDFDAFIENNFSDPEHPYYKDRRDIQIDFPLDGIVCFTIYSERVNLFYENVQDKKEFLTFDLNTGEKLTIRDFADGDDKEICEAVIRAVEESEYGSEYRPGYFTSTLLDDLGFFPHEGGILVRPTFSMVGLGDKYRYDSFEVEIPLGGKWQSGGTGSVPQVPAELAPYFAGGSAGLTPEDAGLLAGEMRSILDEARTAYEGEADRAAAFGGRACLFSLGGRAAALVIGGGYDPANPHIFKWPVAAGVVYINDVTDKAERAELSYYNGAYVYDGGYFTKDFNGIYYDVHNYSSSSGRLVELQLLAPPDVDAGTGFDDDWRHVDGAEARDRIVTGLYDAQKLLDALEGFAGA